jgi:hypothetical protein
MPQGLFALRACAGEVYLMQWTSLKDWAVISGLIASFFPGLGLYLQWKKEGGRQRSKRIQVIDEAAKTLEYIQARLHIFELASSTEDIDAMRVRTAKDAVKVQRWMEVQLQSSGSPIEEELHWRDTAGFLLKSNNFYKTATLQLPMPKPASRDFNQFKRYRSFYYAAAITAIFNIAVMILLFWATTADPSTSSYVLPTLYSSLVLLFFSFAFRAMFKKAVAAYKVAYRLSLASTNPD